MEAFVGRALKQIRERTSRSDKDLRTACDVVLTEISKKGLHPGKATQDVDEQGAADKYWNPFKRACEHRKQEIRRISLDCIEKLIAHGFIRGTGPPSATVSLSKANTTTMGKHKDTSTLIDEVVQTICECKENATPPVELQIIKALLTVVSSPSCKVHGMSLVYAVRACYQIYLVSKNNVNKITAKGCLTQILHVVFQSMEDFDVRRRADLERTGRRSWVDGHPDEAILRILMNKKLAAPRDQPIQDFLSAQEYTWLDSHADAEHFKKMLTVVKPRKHAHKNEVRGTVQTGGRRNNGQRSNSKTLALNVESDLLSVYPEVARVLDLHRLLLPSSETDSKHADISANNSEKTPGTKKKRNSSHVKHRSIQHQDAFLLFRALCNLSVKSHTDDDTGLVNPYGLQSKILSLELILSILRQSTLSFRTNITLINGMREYLCSALLENCLSSESEIVELSLTLFMVLVDAFKDHLMVEIEAFICEIFLRVLESSSAPFIQKKLVLQTFHKLCQDKNTLVEIFLNYDVTLDASGLPNLHGVYEQIVQALEKVVMASGKKHSLKPSGMTLDSKQYTKMKKESFELALLGLKSLSAILDSLSKFLPLNQEQEPEKRSVSPVNLLVDNANNAQMSNRARVESIDVTAASEAMQDAVNEQSVGRRFDEQQQLKIHLKAAFKLFNKKPRTGVEFLQKKGIIETGDDAAKSIANWLATYPDDLDKTQIGDYLGDERYTDIMHAYVALMDFAGLGVDEGIRIFLAGFRLPGEAQKIDRMMEAFAAKFCGNNPRSFENCDACFVLSYSIIMLNTDLHNENIPEEKKISFEAFVKMTRGINNGKDFPREYLEGIYTRIKSDAISLKEDDEARAAAAKKKITQKHAHGGRAQSHALLQMDVGVKVKAAKATMLKNQRKYHSGTINYTKASDATESHVRPMFEVSCYQILAVFSVMLEHFEGEEVIMTCVKGVRRAVHIAGLYIMEKPLRAFIDALRKFCNLSHEAAFAPKSLKSIQCMKELLAIALEEGNNLHSSWEPVMATISQIARLQSFADGEYEAESKLLDALVQDKPGSTEFRSPTNLERGAKLQQLLKVARGVVTAVDARKIDRVFMRSPQLNESAIKHFVISLTQVSREELGVARLGENISVGKKRKNKSNSSSSKDDTTLKKNETTKPRKFCLQKVVEVADYNMGYRGRFVWSQIWAVLSDHFTLCGCHHDLGVAMYAIDSLKQLSMKFLSKEEIRGFKFQKAFLKPFETIIKQSQDATIRELILCVVQNMVLARANNIRSGWKNILVVLAAAASDKNHSLVQLGFDVAASLVKNHFLRIRGDFLDLLSCLLAFARGTTLGVSLDAIDLLRRCAVHLALGHVPFDGDNTDAGSATTSEVDGLEQQRMEEIAAMSEADFEHILGAAHSQSAMEVPVFAPGQVSMPMVQKNTEQISEEEFNENSNVGHNDQKENSIVQQPSINTEVKSVEEEMSLRGSVSLNVTHYTSAEEHVNLWWPLLMGLVDLVIDRRLEVRIRAVQALLGSFFVAGSGFAPDLWESIFKAILFPIFDDTSHGGREPLHPPEREAEWLCTTCLAAFGALVDLFGKFFSAPPPALPHVKDDGDVENNKIKCGNVQNDENMKTGQQYTALRFLLPDLLALFERCGQGKRGHEFASLAVRCEQALLINCGHLFSEHEWDLAIMSLQNSLQNSLPVELLRSGEWHWSINLESQDIQQVSAAQDESLQRELDDTVNSAEQVITQIDEEQEEQEKEKNNITQQEKKEKGVMEDAESEDGSGRKANDDFHTGTLSSFFSNEHEYEDNTIVQLPPKEVVDQCHIHIDLLQAVMLILQKNLLDGPDCDAIAATADGIDTDVLRRHRLNANQVDNICNMLESSYDMAVAFNEDAAHRQALAAAGFSGNSSESKSNASVKNLLTQEISATRKLLAIIFPFLKDDRLSNTEDKFCIKAQARLPRLVTKLVKRYVALDVFVLDKRCEDQPDRYEEGRMRNRLTPIIVSTVTQLSEMSQSLFRQQLPWLYPLLCDLMGCSNRDLRLVIADLFRSENMAGLLKPGATIK